MWKSVLIAALWVVVGVVFFFLVVPLIHADMVTIKWTANAPEEKVVNYRVHVGNASRSYDQAIDAGNVTQHTMDLDLIQDWWLAVTAVSQGGFESPLSDEVTTYLTAPAGIQLLKQ